MEPEFVKLLNDSGTRFEKSAPYRQGQDGVAERGLAIRWRMVLAMMGHSCNPEPDWGHAFNYANKIVNMLPSSSNDGLSPNEMWGDCRSELNMNMVWGCKAFARRYIRGKMEENAVECVALGIAED